MALAGGTGLWAAAPARAGSPSVTLTSPGQSATLTSSTPSISGAVSATSPNGSITGDLQLVITSAAGHPGWSTTIGDWCGQPSCRFSQPVSPALVWNGRYTLTVSASETDASGTESQPVTYVSAFNLAAPAPPPSGLTATNTGSGVSLAWQAEQYPDLVGYRVTRSPTGSHFPAAVTSTGYLDRDVTAGTSYTYQVTAVRQGATSGSTVQSDPATATVALPAPANDTSPAGSGGSAGSGRAGSASSSSGLGTYGSAGTSSSAGSLSSFDSLLQQTAAASPALPAPAVPSVPQDGVAPGTDNPAVAPFSSGSSQAVASGPTGDRVTLHSIITTNHAAVVRDYAAVALAALLLAVMAHLLWLRRQLAVVPTDPLPVRRRPRRPFEHGA